MAKFELTWTIDVDIPDEVIAKTSRTAIRESIQKMIASGATTEFGRYIGEWLDMHKGKEDTTMVAVPFVNLEELNKTVILPSVASPQDG